MNCIKVVLFFLFISDILCFPEKEKIINYINAKEISSSKSRDVIDNTKADNNDKPINEEQGQSQDQKIKLEKRKLNGFFWLFLIMFLAAVITAIVFIYKNDSCLKKQRIIKEDKKEVYKNI